MPDARLSAPPRRRVLALTSLVDVIFLLLLFFMLTSTFARHAQIDLTAAAPGGATVPDTPPLFLRLGVEDLTLNARPLALTDLRPALEDSADGTALLIALQDGVTAQRLVDLLALLRGVPLRVQVLQ